jgi:hypothetical protein
LLITGRATIGIVKAGTLLGATTDGGSAALATSAISSVRWLVAGSSEAVDTKKKSAGNTARSAIFTTSAINGLTGEATPARTTPEEESRTKLAFPGATAELIVVRPGLAFPGTSAWLSATGLAVALEVDPGVDPAEMAKEESCSTLAMPLEGPTLLAVGLKATSPATTSPVRKKTSAFARGGEAEDNGPGSGLRRLRSSNQSTPG